MPRAAEVHELRREIAAQYVPGVFVSIKHHNVGDMSYDYVRLWPRPAGGGSQKVKATVLRFGSLALIVSNVEILGERWALLLTDNVLGWTNEFEGFKALKSPRVKAQ